MFRVRRPIREFFSIMQKMWKKISLKRLLLVAFLAVLFTVNGAFWYLRFFGKGPQQPQDYSAPKEWEINLNEEKIPDKAEDEQEVEQEPAVEPGRESAEPVPGSQDIPPADTAEVKGGEKTAEAGVVEAFAGNPSTMAMPVLGKIITEHSSDGLVYSKTLEQWCVHKGVDIAADTGTPVKAAMAGTVVEVRNSDPKLGVVVVIDHGNGIKTLYGNLMSDNLVQKGKQVKKGDVIGGVGKTAPYEIEDPPHLHFEVLKGTESIDPRNFLPDL
ncbi:M23 family metallopeptidase [Thermosediminibacter litoriperuensis]|uniref:Peptidase M23-like protein n=1 Tax=Thermosediminibacter litoriperuensis TaxID=291989 RepID=A0A5S5AZC1_9FIRM|nr:M23 family metallopeptidase [Thermosediminibacter litoriperuensis]TYP58801.1 peptidase M23-like protein [Thermosediminibacter litoriperuensis]